jgi:glycosyltransferase involved in cell wall biosynthesis
MTTHIYTSLAANYLAKARVLAQSVKKFHPEFLFHVVLCDAVPDWFSLEQEPFDSLITLHDLGLKNPEQWIFKHTLVELSTAVKGFVLERLLAAPGCTQVLYLDPDIVVLSPLDRLLAEFANASILLTPHIAEPEATAEAILDNEVSVLQHGIYNLGFIGVKNSAEGRRFAAWWADRLEHFCYDDIPRGIFTDQRWADLIPAYFPDHKILRDAAYNVCTWNLTNRHVTGSLREGLLVDDQPITFYHFSGFDSGAQQGMLDKYGRTMPALYELREWYVAECERMGQSQLSDLRWAYAFFDNGERVLKIHRKLYRERDDLQSAFPNPYSTRDLNQSYLHWFIRKGESGAGLLNTSASTDSPSTPDYRVFVVAAPGDAAFVQETLEKVWERTVRSDQIFFVAGQAALSASHIPESIQPIEIECERYDDLFAAVLDRFRDRDALLIRAGAVPPHKWDLRLAWSATRQPGIATVSPIDERLLDKSSRFRSSGDDDLLDRLCYWYRPRADLEVASFSRDCVYVCVNALRGIPTLEKYSRPLDPLDQAGTLRYSHVLATHICVGWRTPRAVDELASVDSNGSSAITRLHHRIRAHFHANSATPPAVTKSLNGANLHIVHSWGAGVEQWVGDYSRSDRDHHNFVLKSFGKLGSFGTELRLFGDIEHSEPLQVWRLDPCIKATAPEHAVYQDILTKVVQRYGIQRILVSSLIGHSLDALRQPLATVFVCHDYYPFCPAFNITFGQVCRSCEEPRLAACTYDNPHNRFFPNVPPGEWMRVRRAFAAAVKDHAVTVIAPSPSVRENYTRLLSELAPSFRVIPHGTAPIRPAPSEINSATDARLRVIVLGSLAPHKGGLLFECIVPELLPFCDLMLVGCGDYGRAYAENPKITVVPEYKHGSLPDLIAQLKPSIGLLLSVVPETFSYTLGELQDLRVPVLATKIGSFVDRIKDGVTGLLCAPEPHAIVLRLREVADNPHVLQRIHENLENLPHRSAEEMLRDYERLHPSTYSPRAYFSAKLPDPVPQSSLQLFWRTGKTSFEEKNSISVTPFGRERQILRLHLNVPAEPIEQLRLDPSKQKDFFFLHALSLHDPHDRVLWNWDGDIATLQSILCNEMSFFHPRDADAPALLYFTGSDPYLIPPISAGVLAHVKPGSYVEIEFRLASAEDQVDALISDAARSQSALGEKDSELRQFRLAIQQREQHVQQLETEIRRGDSRVRELENQIAAIEKSISWRMTRPGRRLAAFGRRMKRRVRRL